MTQSDRSWLVKSSTRILGPFDQEGIRQLILNKQISVIDEVKTPVTRWIYIRENKLFKEAVEMVRAELSNMSEETMTQSVTHQTFTKTDALTESKGGVVNFNDELTPPPAPLAGASSKNNVPYLKDVTTAKENPVKNGVRKGKSYGVLGDSEFQKRIEQKSRSLRWVVLVMAAVVVGGAIYLSRNKSKPSGKSYNDYITAAYKYKSLGLYEQALKNYKDGALLQDPNIEVKAAMAPLMIQVEHQTLAGRRILEQYLINRDLSRGELSEVNLSLALSYMLDQDYSSADKTLQKILATDPHNKYLKLNFAALRLEKGDVQGAYEQFRDLLDKYGDFREALIGKIVSALKISAHSNSKSLLIPLSEEVERALEKSPYLKHELLVLQGSVESELGNVNGVQRSVNLFLAGLPVLTQKYSKQLFGYQGFFRWERLEPLCADIYRKSPGYSELKAFYSQCLKRANRDIDSSRLLNEAYKESPKSPYVLLALANEYIEQNRSPEAFSLLKQPELLNVASKDILMGNVCIQTNDLVCSKGAFNSSYRKSGKDISSVYGLAWVAYKSDNRSLAYQYINEGLQIAPNFMPIIELRDMMESR